MLRVNLPSTPTVPVLVTLNDDDFYHLIHIHEQNYNLYKVLNQMQVKYQQL